ncbi:uracil permease [Thecaphora frezii]
MSKLLRVIQVKGSDRLPGESHAQAFMRNEDLLPVPPSRRTWGGLNFAAFWISDGLNLNTFMIASTAVSAGLTWSQAWAAIIVGYFVVAFLVVATARIGAVYHCSFPILARSTFGIWGAIWPTLNRAVMACIWYGVQAYIGGQCMTLVLRCLAPSYNNIRNGLPASAGVTTRDFVSFFLFSLISLPLVYLKPQNVRWFFNVKSIVVPIAAIAFFAWSIADAHGLGPIVKQPAKVHGTEFSWTFLSTLMSCISNMSTLVLNIPDMSRMAKSTRSVTWSQLISIPLTFSITSFFGIIIASSSSVIYGREIWNPVDLLGARLEADPYDSKARAGVFFIAFAFIIGQIGTNIAANSLSAGHDLAALLPRYITIRRGSFVAAAVGFAMCPWQLTKDSNSFATYLSAYSLFLSSISGCMLCDYYVVRRGVLNVPSLFSSASKKSDPTASSHYYYFYGFNLRAFAAYISGILMSVTGFAGVLGADVSQAAERIYILAYPIGFLTSALVYLLLCQVWPVEGGIKLSEGRQFLEPKSWESDDWTTQDSAYRAHDVENAPSIADSSDKKQAATLGQQVTIAEYQLYK